MLKATGQNSMLLVKTLQRNGLLTASKYKLSAKWHRAWTIDDLLTISLASDTAAHAGLSIVHAVQALSLIPSDMLDGALSISPIIDQVVDFYVQHVDPYGAVSDEAELKRFRVTRPDDFELIVINRQRLFARRKNKETELREVGSFDADAWVSKGASSSISSTDWKEISATAGSLLVIHLSRLGLEPLRKEFGLELDIEFGGVK